MARKSISANLANMIFSDFSKGLYLLDTPRNIAEQITSLAITGGRNIWAEKGALVPQYGYINRGGLGLEQQITGVSKANSGDNSFFIVTLEGKIYLYTASQGLKEYKTTTDATEDIILTRRNKDLIFTLQSNSYIFGSYYDASDEVVILSDVTLNDYNTYYEFTVTPDNIQYFWNGKELSVNNEDNLTVTAINKNSEGNYTVRVIINGDHKAYPDPVTIGEKTLLPITLSYKPEPVNDEPVAEKTITPLLMAVSSNRLFIEDVSGDIYYSQVGVVDGFDQSLGAGFFGGFYNDTSKTLSIEDFLNKVLICKENGIYVLSLGDTASVEKISQVGQTYASDHIIVGEKVYAYDVNSGSIVNAVSVNVFGSMVSGKPIITNEYLDSENRGINTSKRFLTYNAESEVFILYYGENLDKGLVLTNAGTLFPRELDKAVSTYIGFNQGVMAITKDNEFLQDFKKGSIIPDKSYIVNFEPIGVRDNRLIISTILEITELNGINYAVSVSNSGYSYQTVTPSFNLLTDRTLLPPFLYSTEDIQNPSYELTSKWATKSSNVTRLACPMSGREGISISLEFPANIAFCLTALRLPDFSQGD